MAIQLPSINVDFKKKANTAIQRSQRGIVALLLDDEATEFGVKIKSITDIPGTLTSDNKKLIELCLIGNNDIKPKRIDIYAINSSKTLNNVLEAIEVTDINYICYPGADSEKKTTIKTRVEQLREDGVKIKFITAELAADSEAVINFTTDDIVVGGITYSNAQYTARIAGLIASTKLNQSITYAELKEVDSIPYISKSDAQTKIANGELILFKQANVIRVARGVNSLKTTNDRSEEFKKIKLVDIMDLIETDIADVCATKYVGKVANNYDNKCILIAAIGDYLTELAKEQLIENDFTIDIDIEAQKAYLKENGYNIDEMSENEIKKANTGDKVFLNGTIKLIDAIEEVSINFAI